jgi:hypothetical protein
MDTEHPIVKIGDFIFEGTFDELQGTALLFEHESAEETVKYCPTYRTRKILRLQRLLMKPSTELETI